MPVYAEAEVDVEELDVCAVAMPPDTPDHELTSRKTWAVMPDESSRTVTTGQREFTRDELSHVLRVLKPKGKLIVT